MTKIIIGIPNHFDLPERIKKNLEHLGFQVYTIPFRDEHIKKIPIKEEIKHIYRKVVYKDRSYKKEVRVLQTELEKINFIKKIKTDIDYGLFLRPDLFGSNVIKEAKQKTNKIVAYQWDGLERFPLVKKLIYLFDQFYVFDVRDLGLDLHPSTNFYFDDIKSDTIKPEIDVFFVGTYMTSRINLLQSLNQEFKRLNLKTNLILKHTKEENINLYKQDGIFFTKESMSFEDNLKNVLNAKIILDFSNPVHYGISMRTFSVLVIKRN